MVFTSLNLNETADVIDDHVTPTKVNGRDGFRSRNCHSPPPFRFIALEAACSGVFGAQLTTARFLERG